MIEIEPCYFCGNAEVKVAAITVDCRAPSANGLTRRYRVQCKCGAHGNHKSSIEKAAFSWGGWQEKAAA